MKQGKIILLLLVFTHTAYGSDRECKRPSGHYTASIDGNKGPIARTTGLPAPLVALIVGFRGPIYAGAYSKQIHDGAIFSYPGVQTYLQMYHDEATGLSSIGVHAVVIVYKRNRQYILWDKLFNVSNLSEMDMKEKFIKAENASLAPIVRTKRADSSLTLQKAATEIVLTNHKNIPLSVLKDGVVAIESPDAVFTHRIQNRKGILEKWSLVDGDLEPASSACAIS